MNDTTLLKHLVEYRANHNLTQAELANILGVTRERLYRWVTGKVKLRSSMKSPANAALNEFDFQYNLPSLV